jgi:hypothetical protein
LKGYKGQVTAKGLPVVQYKGKNYQIPQQGVSKSLKSNLLASTSKTALSSRWNAQKKTAVKKRVGALAAGTAVAAVSNGSGGGGSGPDAKSAKAALELRKKLAHESQMTEEGTIIAGSGSKSIFRDADRIAKTYGGSSSDWVKKSSTSADLGNGYHIETHWVENIKTGKRVEFKTKEVFTAKPRQ